MEQTGRRRNFRYPAIAAGLVLLGALTGYLFAGSARPAGSSTPEAAAPATAGGAALLPRPANDVFPAIAKAETSAVGNITTTRPSRCRGSRGCRAVLRPAIQLRHPGGPGTDPDSAGSGFIIDQAGYVLTNRHVVDGAERVTVMLADGHRYPAKVVGQDARTDVALLKIEPREKLAVLKLGDSDKAEVGEWVMAVGNPFGLGGNSVTVGVVSYKGRPLDISGGGPRST